MSKKAESKIPSTFKEFAESNSTETALFQARIDADLLEKVRKIRNESNMSWQQVVEYCFHKLVLENEKKVS